MTNQERNTLLAAIDALCEGELSAAQLAFLEQMVLSDSAARRLYVEAIALHGSLHWDAAGAGAMEAAVSPRPQAVPARSPRLRRFVPAIAIPAGIALLLTVIMTGLLPKPPVANSLSSAPAAAPRPDSQPAPWTSQIVNTTEAQSRIAPADRAHPIPEISLPAIPRAAPHEADAENSVATQAVPGATAGTIPAVTPIGEDQKLAAEIDRLLQVQQQDSGVPAARTATDAEWIRRVYLDLAGRIPTVDEAEAYFHDSRADKVLQLVDTLLNSPEFARQEATVWTNLLIGHSRTDNIDRTALFHWLSDQFADNRPWRETAMNLVAAKGTPAEGPTNFLLAHLNNQAVPATAITARIFLCEQLQCAQCHQHPVVKSWDQSRFWELNAFFQQTKIIASPEAGSGRNGSSPRMRQELVDASVLRPTYYESLRGVMQVAYPRYAGVEVQTSPKQSLRTQLAELMFAEDRPQAARAFVNRTWAQFFQYGFTFPLDDMGPHTPVSHPQLLEQLTADFVASEYDVRKLVRVICLTQAYRRSSQPAVPALVDDPAKGDLPLFAHMYIRPMTAEQLHDSLWIAAGISPRQLLTAQHEMRREDWLKQFYRAVDTEENSEATTFGETLPQALMMMNGDLVRTATTTPDNRLLEEVINRHGDAEADRIRRLSLAALSRYPTPEELNTVRDALRRSIRHRTERNMPTQLALAEGLKDLYWAYLNSSEFAISH